MYLPKADITNLLKQLSYFVSQNQPAVFNELPAIIFKINNNSITTDLDNNILSQDIEIIIDIYAEDSITASKVLSEVEEILRNDLYNMTFSGDIPNTSNLYHINARFNKKI